MKEAMESLGKILTLDIDKVENIRYLNKPIALWSSLFFFGFVIIHGCITGAVNKDALVAATGTLGTVMGFVIGSGSAIRKGGK